MKKNGKLNSHISIPSQYLVHKEINHLTDIETKMIIACDNDYPDLLLKTYAPPPIHTMKGDFSLFKKEK